MLKTLSTASYKFSSIPVSHVSPLWGNHSWAPKRLGGTGGGFDIVVKFQTYIERKIIDKNKNKSSEKRRYKNINQYP